MEMLLSIEWEFSAAHRLPFYEGPCKRLHGHTYRLRATLKGRPSPKDGMVRDFDEVKKKVWDTCLVACDHHCLNDVMENPTAENIVIWMWDRIAPEVEGLVELQLWETSDYCVTYRKA